MEASFIPMECDDILNLYHCVICTGIERELCVGARRLYWARTRVQSLSLPLLPLLVVLVLMKDGSFGA
eukprot:2088692-Rhodomonas_salina.2